jgi:hypothetical protein
MKASFSSPRHEPRIRVDLPATLRFGWKNCEQIKASILDMSTQGLRARCPAPLRNGLDVEVVMANAPDDAKSYRVTWVRDSSSSEHSFDIGLQLRAGPHAQDTSTVYRA